VFVVLKFLTEAVVFVAGNQLAESGEQHGVLPGLMGAVHRVEGGEQAGQLLHIYLTESRVFGQLLQLTKNPALGEVDMQKLASLLTAFNTMYRPHESREDTVLFPAFRKLVSRHEYDSLGEEFENNEHKRFGQDGFETMVAKVADIEKQLGIYDLSQFTPS